MRDPLRDPELLRVAKRMVWFKPPEDTLRDPVFLSEPRHDLGHGRRHPGRPVLFR